RIGPFLIGPLLGNSPVKCISQYLVRKEGTGKYFMAKVFTENQKPGETRSGKMLLHTEHSLLSLLSSHPGVIRQYGLFKVRTDGRIKDTSCNPTSGDVTPRVGLIVDCLVRHEKSVATNNYLNLQQHVIQVKRLSEREALRIFHSVVSVIVSLHKMNVVHRDLKLGNMVLDKRTRKITLINFCLGCHLNSERDLLTDQLGCPAYISPDVLSDKPYAGKPSDMWSLGVVLYTMLYGQFPFYDQAPKKLFAKIKTAEYSIPSSGQASANTNDVIHGLLTLNPLKRLTAVEALDSIESCAAAWYVLRTPTTPAQVVPDVDD
uniref:Serine/threonine-protein kinase 40 n=1 Tax=Ciona intestinalis TaxID=7719 RepID=H2XWX0_CIOIN